jgi:hypothetical protein
MEQPTKRLRGQRGKGVKEAKEKFLLGLSPDMMTRVTEFAEKTKLTKTAVIEQALEQFFGV